MKFVWLEVRGGGQVPVNPDLVAYLRAGSAHDEGATEVVFGAVQGGLHSVVVAGDGYEVARRLEGAASREDVSRWSDDDIDAYLQRMAAAFRRETAAHSDLAATSAPQLAPEAQALAPAPPARPKGAPSASRKAARPQRT